MWKLSLDFHRATTTYTEKPSQVGLLAPLSTSGLFTETTCPGSIRSSYTISALRDEALQETKTRQQQPSSAASSPIQGGDSFAIPNLNNQKREVKNRTSYTGLAFVHRRVCTPGLMPGAPLFSWDATGSLLQAQRRQESVFYLPHGVTCCNPDKIHIRVHSGTHTHNMRWDSFKFSSTAMSLEF